MLTNADLTYTLDQLQLLAGQSRRLYHHLVLLCGSDWQTRTQVLQASARQMDWLYLSVGLPLAELLSQRTPRQRPLYLERDLEAILPNGPGLVLDHLEILFDADLRSNPLPVLEHISKQRPLLVCWPGQMQGDKLIYAEPWHAEYRSYPLGERLFYTLP